MNTTEIGEKRKRLTRLQYYLTVLHAVRERATCDRGRAGAIIVKEGRIICTGYVGAPSGLPHCDDVGHLMRGNHCIRTVHAEMNAILQAARFGISIEGATMYCTMVPCYECAKAIINSGITRVIAEQRYQSDKDSILLLKEAGIDLVVLKNQVLEY